MPTNDFLPFAIDPAANVITQGAWGALPARTGGFVAGLAQSNQLNKAWRQAAVMAAMLGDTILTYGALDALDDGNVANLRVNFMRTLRDNGTAFVVATGTANAWVLAPTPSVAAYTSGQGLDVVPPATNTSTTVYANVSGLGNKRVKRSDGTDPAIGDIIGGRAYASIYNGTDILILATLPSDVAAQKALVNIVTFPSNTRQNMVGNAGNSYTVMAWTPANYIKKSPTSNVLVQLVAPSFTPGAAGSSAAAFTIGGQTKEVVASNAQPATTAGPTVLNHVFSGLAAGSLVLSLAYKRYDTTAWNSVYLPNNTDASYLPAVSTASLVIGEFEP